MCLQKNIDRMFEDPLNEYEDRTWLLLYYSKKKILIRTLHNSSLIQG